MMPVPLQEGKSPNSLLSFLISGCAFNQIDLLFIVTIIMSQQGSSNYLVNSWQQKEPRNFNAYQKCTCCCWLRLCAVAAAAAGKYRQIQANTGKYRQIQANKNYHISAYVPVCSCISVSTYRQIQA
jgi:hypothetical protein